MCIAYNFCMVFLVAAVIVVISHSFPSPSPCFFCVTLQEIRLKNHLLFAQPSQILELLHTLRLV